MERQPGTSTRPLKVLIVDDHPIVRKGLTLLLNQEADFDVCAEAEDVESAKSLIEKHRPDCVILDLSLEGKSGLDLLTQIRDQNKDLPILILSIHEEAIYAERALKAGANGYIMKRESTENLIAAIHTVLDGEIYLGQELRNNFIKSYFGNKSAQKLLPIERLTKREFEVLQLIGQGYQSRKIARQLQISIKTVESHREHIKDKLNLKNSAELVHFAIKWVETEPSSLP